MNEESLFHEALARSAGGERDRFLEAACVGQPELRAAVDALLSAHSEGSKFLGRPLVAAPACESAPGASLDTVNRDGTTDPENQPPAPIEPAQIPQRIGRYEIRRLLGRGGMGAVYLAHDPELHRLVALKIPRLAGPGAEERFLREARAAAAVTHPNLCPVHDAGRADGVLYLAMAYVPGSTLADLLKKDGPLAPARAVAMATRIASAMAEAHRHGIVHRDLKPGNVLLDRQGEPVVTDFGLALRGPVASADNGNQTADFEPRLTQAGILMGTPTYMPPEQACGDLDKVGPASDVYALGAILFELLTGRVPFRADTIAQLVRKILAEPAPAPSRVRPGVPASLDAVCAKALAKDPADRFASMEEFAGALAAATAGGKRRTRARVAIAAAAVFLFSVAAAVFYVKTDYGTIEVRFNDPNASVEVSVDGGEVTLTDNGRITKLRAGQHGLVVTGSDYETETKLFKVKRGQTTVVEVELKPKSIAAAGSAKTGSSLSASDRTRLVGLLASGRHLISKDRFDELGPVADDALKIDPESSGALALRATFRSSRNDFVNARIDVDAALKLNPENYRALYVRAYLHFMREENEECVADTTAAIRLNPTDPAVWMNRASAYVRLGEFKQAISDANQAIKYGATREHVYINRGAAHGALGDYTQALVDLDHAAAVAPSNPTVFLHRSAVHLKAGNAAKAAADMAAARNLVPTLTDDRRPVIPDPPKPPERRKLTSEEAANLAKAMKAADTAWGYDRFNDCEKAIDDAYRIDPTDPAVRSLRSRLWVKQERFKDAMTEANKAIRADPNDAWAYVARGMCRLNEKNSAGAIADATIAIRLDKGNYWAWNNRGYAYALRGQFHQALADLDEALRLKPDFGHAYPNRGMCHLNLGDYENALTDYTNAHQAQPMEARWLLVRAGIRSKLGDIDGAKKDRGLAALIDKRLPDNLDIPLPVPLPPVKKDPEPEPAAALNADRARLAVLLATGRTLVERDRFAELVPVADEALKIDPDSPTALALRATARIDRGDRVGGRADLDAALKLNPETFQALLSRSYLNLEEGKWDDAIADAVAAGRLDPTHPSPWMNRAQAYLKKGEHRQAVADATQAIERKRLAAPFETRGCARVLLGEYEKSLADFDTAAELGGKKASVFNERASVHARLGNAEKATSDWVTARRLNPNLKEDDRVVVPDPPKPPLCKKLTPDEADKLKDVLTGIDQAVAHGGPPAGLKLADQALRIDPTSPEAWVSRCRALSEMGRHREALADTAKAFPFAPDNTYLYLSRGVARAATTAPVAGIPDLTIALTLAPENAYAWGNRGYAYAQRGQYQQGIADLTEAIRLKPYWVFLSNRGSCYIALGQYENALADYKKLVEIQAGNPQWLLNSSGIRARLGDLKGSRADRERAIELEPKVKDAPKIDLPAPLPPAKKDPELPADDPPALRKPSSNSP